jgi:hypothetical protein
MKRKANDRPLMRQRVNVSEVLINKWKENYLFDIRHVIHQIPLEKEHLNQTFEHQGRTFELIGMGEGRTLMLRETRTEGTFYWECTRQFVQSKFGLFNKEFVSVAGTTKTILRDLPYSETELLLAPLKVSRKKATVEETEEPVNEFEQIEDYEDELVDEQQENETDLF